jgi:hypothetical protein
MRLPARKQSCQQVGTHATDRSICLHAIDDKSNDNEANNTTAE